MLCLEQLVYLAFLSYVLLLHSHIVFHYWIIFHSYLSKAYSMTQHFCTPTLYLYKFQLFSNSSSFFENTLCPSPVVEHSRVCKCWSETPKRPEQMTRVCSDSNLWYIPMYVIAIWICNAKEVVWFKEYYYPFLSEQSSARFMKWNIRHFRQDMPRTGEPTVVNLHSSSFLVTIKQLLDETASSTVTDQWWLIMTRDMAQW